MYIFLCILLYMYIVYVRIFGIKSNRYLHPYRYIIMLYYIIIYVRILMLDIYIYIY